MLTFAPLTPKRWPDFEELFGPRGACAGCWCMWYRLPRKDFVAGKGARNKARMKSLVAGGASPGILAYEGKTAVGWCAVAPREEYPRLSKSRLFKPLDEKPVWSVSCLFVRKEARNKGVSAALLQAAAAFAKKNCATIVEGYPVDAKAGRMPDAFVWTGLASSYEKAGFTEKARPSRTRPVMRRAV